MTYMHFVSLFHSLPLKALQNDYHTLCNKYIDFAFSLRYVYIFNLCYILLLPIRHYEQIYFGSLENFP